MSVQSAQVVPAIEWDDSVVFVFSWNNQQFFGGFVHQQLAIAIAAGSQTQISNIQQVSLQAQIQVAGDAQSWLDTIKNAARNNKPVTITFEDALSAVYTTQTNQSFTLQQVFSVAG